MQNFLPYENYVKENCKISSRNEISNIYENLFAHIINTYEHKKLHCELPTYLNYLILKSNPILEEFFISKVRIEIPEKIDYLDLIKYTSKNFEKLIISYTNLNSKTLLKLQMIQFYKLQPSSSSLHLRYNLNIDVDCPKNFQNYNNEVLINSRSASIESNADQKYTNPFLSNINKQKDIIPLEQKIYESLGSK